MIDPDAIREARNLLLRLELVSHGRTSTLDPAPDLNRSQLFPAGGISREDDHEPDVDHTHENRSHLYFGPLLRVCETTEQVLVLVAAMESALRAWTHPPRPSRDSVAWQEQLARQGGTVDDVAEDWGVKKEYVWMLRRRYGLGRKRKDAA